MFLNDGHGVFTDSGQSLGDSNTWNAALGDLDGDRDLDVFLGNGFITTAVSLSVCPTGYCSTTHYMSNNV